MIHLHTLGDALITIGEKEIRPSSPMVFAALLYLGVERGRRVPRAALQELLFPNADERSGSHSVRQLLYKLRQLGAPLASTQSSVLLSQADVVDDCALDSADDWSQRDATQAVLGFAPDYTPHLSERFSEWLEHQRVAVGSRVRSALVDVLARKRARADWRSVEGVAHLLLQLDPLNEEATLALAEATAASGSKHRALNLLSAYEQETGASLQLAPTILRKRISRHVEPTREGFLRAPFIGRADEIAAILTLLSTPKDSAASVCAIIGEAGIGKTRLLEEVQRATELSGGRVLVAKCRPDHAHRPLSVFIALVPDLLQSRGALGVSPEALTQLRQLVQAETSGSAVMPSDDDAGRSESLRRALLDLVDAVAGDERLLIAVEDAHWCDAPSLREIRAIASRIPSLRVLLTTRSLEQLKAALLDITTVIRLRPLSPGHMDELATSLLAGRNEMSTRQWCVSVATGNPLYLHMLCGHVSRTGSCTVPKDLKTLIASRLTLLPAIQLRALQYVSLLGGYATVESLRELLQLSPGDFVDCIANLEEQGYFHSATEQLRLTHDLVNDVAQELATPITMKALHAHVAMFLEQRFQSTRNMATLWDCAEQWRLSGESVKSIDLVRQCAAHASAMGQSTRALELLARAKALTNDRHHLEHIIADMILAAKAAGQLNDVLSLHRELRTLTREQHSDTELLGLEAEWLLNDAMDLERLLACVRLGSESPQHSLEACVLLQRYAHENCDEDLARDAYESVRDLLPSAPPKLRLVIEATFHTSFGDTLRAARAIDELVAAIPSFPRVADRLAAARNVAVGLLLLGKGSEAIELADRHRKVARDLGLHTREYEFTGVMAACYITTQDIDNGRRLVMGLGTPPDSRWLNLSRQLSVELALADKDELLAARTLKEMRDAGYGRMIRNRAYLAGAELRLKQLHPKYLCSAEEFASLIELHDRTKRYISDDDFVCALAEDRWRHGSAAEGLVLLDDYVTSSRRQCWVLPPSFLRLRSNLQEALKARSGDSWSHAEPRHASSAKAAS